MFDQMLLIDSLNSVLRSRSVSSERISTGLKLDSAKDDPSVIGFLSRVDMKLIEQRGFSDEINEAQTYLKTQETALKALSEIATRMLTLKVAADQATALGQDIALFQEEYISLQDEFKGITNEQFNGLAMFTPGHSNEVNEYSLFTGGRTFQTTKYSVVDFMQGDSFRVGVTESTFSKITATFNWEDAKIDAESRGGHLAVISDEEEYNKVQLVVGGWGGWIGLQKPVGGSWASVTGEAIYTPWFNNYSGNASQNNAAIIRSGGLNGSWAKTHLHPSYILEIENIISLADVSGTDIESNLQNIALAIAQNGLEQNKLSRIQKITESNIDNLSGISSRIEDLDYASESVKKSKQAILMDGALALLSQANTRSQSALNLLYAKIDQEWEFASKANTDEQRNSKYNPLKQSLLIQKDEDALRT
jgi:flagellin